MQTEPIGFMGSIGAWEISTRGSDIPNYLIIPSNKGASYAKDIASFYSFASGISDEEQQANIAICRASKKMAIALQNARSIFKDHHIKEYRELSESINEILKEAGLND